MNIVIPIGGKGERFSKKGYLQPKPLIQILDKRMIEYVIDNLTLTSEDKVFIIYNFESLIFKKISKTNFRIWNQKK